jgi:hypothetical protein
MKMDAVKFLKEKKRMCISSGDDSCHGCPIYAECGILTCAQFQDTLPNQTVKIVEKWAKEHPRETRLSQFLKYYPNAPLDMYGIPHACVKDFGIVEYEYLCSDDCTDCPDCWNTPIKEE